MQQKIEDGIIFVKASKEEDAIIKTWRMMKKDKEKGYWYGEISRPLLENLQRNGGLIPPAKTILKEMLTIQKAVDKERMTEEPKPLIVPPVKVRLFKHQVRGYNMALMTLGLVEPPKEENESESK